jgi:hypothetical protein
MFGFFLASVRIRPCPTAPFSTCYHLLLAHHQPPLPPPTPCLTTSRSLRRQLCPAFRRGPRGLPGGWRAKRKAVNERQSQAHRNREAIAIEMFAQDLFLFLSSTHEHGYTPRCASKHMSEPAMALCIPPSIPTITARHLVPWHLIQTRRHCRYLEQKLSTPRSVKWDHIVR